MSELNLRIVARIDDPSIELFEYLAKKEGVESPSDTWVDLNIPRDFEWSDEIREKTVEFGIADLEGNILATFGTLREAEEAKGKARISIALQFEDDAPAPKAGKPVAMDPLTSEILSNERRVDATAQGATTVEEIIGLA